MKNAFLTTILLTMAQISGITQNSSDIKNISEAVHSFAQAGDQQDADRLDTILHPQFRAVVHRAFGSADMKLMDKATYLQSIRDKKIGGDTREVHLLQVDMSNNIATVKAIFEGKKLRFITYVSLVKLANGTWQVVDDMPDIEKA